MSEVRASIDIDAAPEAVFDVALDPERLGDWVTIHRELLRADAGPPREGMEMQQRMSLRGAPFKVSWELVVCDRPTHAEWRGRGPARSKAETEYALEALPGGATRFSYRNDFRAPFGPLGAVAGRALVGGIPQKEAIASLTALKALVESLRD
ncbi:MAG: SRPBCC family protein [Actinomycetota bacterium]|nr:SRPBCC family protein [Actinomycetota bacterium]